MKIQKTIVLCAVLSVLPAVPALAQGKGGGGGGGGRGGGNSGGLGERPSMGRSEAARGRPDAAGEGRRDHPDRPSATESEGKGKGARSASPAAHGLASSMHSINQTAFAQRRELHQSLDMNLKSSRDALKQIQADAKKQRIDARADFKAALADVKAREKDLNDRMKASRKASEANWEPARDGLAKAYQAHADALGRLEKIAHAPPSRTLP